MLFDHAARRFQTLVKSQLGATPVVWAPYPGTKTYPWCELQVIDGPTTSRDQERLTRYRQVEWTIAAAALGATVAARIGGRVFELAHTGDATTTAVAAAALMPSHWTVAQVGPVITVSGPDVYGGWAYEGGTSTAVEIGPVHKVEVLRREMLVQCTIWCLQSAGLPQRWDETGCDALAIKVHNKLRIVEPDPYRVYIEPYSAMRPFYESYGDGREYIATSFDSRVTWVDFNLVTPYGTEALEFIETVTGLLETTDGVTTNSDALEAP